MMYVLTAMGLAHSDNSTVHIYTPTIHRTTQSTQTVRRTTRSTQTIHRTTQQLVTRHSEDSDRSKIKYVTDLILM
jgi:hypothetical protein